MFSKFQIRNNDNQNQRAQICKQSMTAFGENVEIYYSTSESHILEHCSHQRISQKTFKPLLVLHSLRFVTFSHSVPGTFRIYCHNHTILVLRSTFAERGNSRTDVVLG
jgi:hypothetical protein